MAKKLIAIRLEEEELKKLKKVSEKENRTLTNLIETILKNHLKKHGV